MYDSEPTFGAGLGFELQVFDGFLRDRSLQAARAELEAASAELERTRDAAVQQVWKSYIDLRTAIRNGVAGATLLKSGSYFPAWLISLAAGVVFTAIVLGVGRLIEARRPENTTSDTAARTTQCPGPTSSALRLAFPVQSLRSVSRTISS